MGSSYDNTEDARNRQLTTRQIRLPNGVILTKNHPWCAGPAQAPRSLVRGYRQTIESQQISPYQTIQVADNWYECPKVPLWLPYRLYLISKEVPLRHNRQSWVAPTPFNLWWLEDQDTLRKKHGLSQVALAEKLGVTEATVNRWERGHTNIPYERLKQVASLFKVRPADIVPDLDEIPPSLLNTTLDEVAHV
jgi:DNA-binding XRE family transcriptional regulator